MLAAEKAAPAGVACSSLPAPSCIGLEGFLERLWWLRWRDFGDVAGAEAAVRAIMAKGYLAREAARMAGVKDRFLIEQLAAEQQSQ